MFLCLHFSFIQFYLIQTITNPVIDAGLKSSNQKMKYCFSCDKNVIMLDIEGKN